ncbi:MAG: hypothetical protein SGBAC_006318 [Bacillariaceae sp.]
MTRQGIASNSFSSSVATKLYYTKGDNNGNGNKNNHNNNKNGQDGNKDDKETEARRMEVVRSLQMAFYKSDAEKKLEKKTNAETTAIPTTPTITTSTTTTSTSQQNLSMTRLEASSGKLRNLPLWRAPWWEVPGRSDVLNVHDPIYTNMFESIIRKPKPWCFGHLFLKGGSDNLREGSLATWETFGQSKCTQHSAVMGCLMHIQDYRRLSNGRLLLLVHAMERFAVTDIQQELPYSIVDAQILPDPEELDPAFLSLDMQEEVEEQANDQFVWTLTEDDLQLTRGMAVQESVRYHDYEYDPEQTLAGISNKTYLEPTDIMWSTIARLLPFCPFAKTLAPPLESEVKATLQQHFGKQLQSSSSSSSSKNNNVTLFDQDSESEQAAQQEPQALQDQPPSSLESQLFQKGILRAPLFDPEYASRYDSMDTDQLEYELWLAMNRYLSASKIPISPVVLGLLPRRPVQEVSNEVHDGTTTTTTTTTTTNVEDWPADFSIYNTVRDLEATQLVPTNTTTGTTTTTSSSPAATLRQQKARHDFVRVHPHYPKHRRQKRLSYSALSLLEKTSDLAKQLRPEFLATPSTKQRLRLVLEKLDQWQEEFWGEFQ